MKKLIVQIKDDILVENCTFGIELSESDVDLLAIVNREGEFPRVTVDVATATAKINLRPVLDISIYRVPVTTAISNVPSDIVNTPCSIFDADDAEQFDPLDGLIDYLFPAGADDGFDLFIENGEEDHPITHAAKIPDQKWAEDVLFDQVPQFFHDQYSEGEYQALVGSISKAAGNLADLISAHRVVEGERRRAVRDLQKAIDRLNVPCDCVKPLVSPLKLVFNESGVEFNTVYAHTNNHNNEFKFSGAQTFRLLGVSVTELWGQTTFMITIDNVIDTHDCWFTLMGSGDNLRSVIQHIMGAPGVMSITVSQA